MSEKSPKEKREGPFSSLPNPLSLFSHFPFPFDAGRFFGIRDFPYLKLGFGILKQNRGEIRDWKYARKRDCRTPLESLKLWAMTLYWVSSIKKPWSYSLIFKKILEYRLILEKKVTSDMPQVFKNDKVAVTFHAGSNAQKFSLIRPHRLWETGVYKTLLIRLPMPLSRYGRKPWFKIRINLQVNRAGGRCLRKQHHALHFIFLSLLIFILLLFILWSVLQIQ